MDKILLISPKFYSYEQEIIQKLSEFGFLVTYINADPSKFFSTFMGVSEKFGINRDVLVEIFEKRCFSKIPNCQFDYVLIICGWAITSRLVGRIKSDRLKENGRMALYYWDSLARLKDDVARWDFFDDIFTFDSSDYEKHKDRLKFLPLFYCDKYWNNKVDSCDCDVLSIGTFRLNRLMYLRQLAETNPSIKIKHYLYTKRWVIVFHKLFRSKYRNVDYSELKYEKLSFQNIVDMYRKSRAVLDVPAIGQDGLTIRTFEAFAMHKKLITSNENIVKYNFFNSNDIYVMKPGDYTLPSVDWFSAPFAMSNETIKQYSISSWIKQILGNE